MNFCLPFCHRFVIWVYDDKVLQPVRTITRTANEITATDLRRRLHLQRRDEFGELAATFDHMLARLEAAFKRQTQFTADVSHELRTPLSPSWAWRFIER